MSITKSFPLTAVVVVGTAFTLGVIVGMAAIPKRPSVVTDPGAVQQAYADGIHHTVKLLLDRKLIRAPLFLNQEDLKSNMEFTVINVLESPTPTNGLHPFNCAVHVEARDLTNINLGHLSFRIVDCGDMLPSRTLVSELR